MELQKNKKDMPMGIENMTADAELQEIQKELAENPEMKKELEQQVGLSLMHSIMLCKMLGTTIDQFMAEHPMKEFEESFQQMMMSECDDEECDDCDDEECENDECGCC